MALIDKLISEISNVLEYFSETTGLSSIFLICTICLVFLFFIFWLIILLKIRGIRKILIDINRRMNAISIISRQQSSRYNPTINQQTSQPTTIKNTQDKFVQRTQKLDNAHESNTTFSVQDESQGHGSKKNNYKSSSKDLDITKNLERQEITKSFPSHWSIERAIYKIIDESYQPVSLHEIGQRLSGEYFDGNYNLILNTLERLEKEGLIEGSSKSGKVLFKKKL